MKETVCSDRENPLNLTQYILEISSRTPWKSSWGKSNSQTNETNLGKS